MNLSELDNMLTQTSFSENADEIKAVSSPDDLDFGIGKLDMLPVLCESTCVRADEPSAIILRSDVSAADCLLSPFDSISFNEGDIANSTVKCDDISSICESNLQGQTPDEKSGSGTHDSSDPARIHGLSRHGDTESEVVDEIERTQKSNDHLIVYTSSRKNSARNTSTKLSHNKDSKNSSINCKVITRQESVPDIKSLHILRRRRSRSLISKQDTSSARGFVGLPTLEENDTPIPCSANGKIIEGGGGQGKSSIIKDQTGQKAVCKSSTSTGRISLKIKIGNQSCGVLHMDKNLSFSGKSISGLSNKTESKFQENFPGEVLSPNENKLENVRTSNASGLGAHLDGISIVKNKSLHTLSGHQISSHEEGDNLSASTENRCSDPGTSPDSEVINYVPDAPLGERNVQDLQDSPVMPLEKTNRECFENSIAGVSIAGNSSLSFPELKSSKGKKTTGAKTKHKVRAPLGLGPSQKGVDISKCDDIISTCPASYMRMTNSETPCTTSNKVRSGIGVNHSLELSDATDRSKSQARQSLVASSNRQKSHKCPRSKGECKSKNGILVLPRKKGTSKMKGDRNNFLVKHQIDEKDDVSSVLSGVDSHPEKGNQALPDLGQIGEHGTHSAGLGSVSSSIWLKGQYAIPRNAWVLCDECQKWRRIPATLADQIEQTNCGWTCKDNTDGNFADCSIPQEKSNSEINKELEISDASCDEDAGDTLPKSNKNKSTAAKQSSWTLIKSNLFLHRSRKTQTIDEVMVCHCKPPSDGRMGCGSKCLNRMLNIECVRGTCPCGELCSNQQFQKRLYAKLKWLRCGKKGYGLQALQDISEGQFLIEYVGEVLDVRAHEARQKEYALQGHKHFYFMTLNGSEVIDACAKGNLGRFMNHSCDPNCRTEKWMVNGEVCIGLFAIRDIKKGDEVTFDYNYVRVLGAAAKKCVCGSPNCRGYIGGDPTNSEVIVQEDSDDEYAEPVMICKDRAMNSVWTDIMSQSLYEKKNACSNELDEDRYKMKNADAARQFESITSGTSNGKLGVDSASSGCTKKTSTATRFVHTVVQDKYEQDNSVNESASNTAGTHLDITEDSLNSSGSANLKDESESLLSQNSSPVKLVDASLLLKETMNSTMSKDLHFDDALKISATALPGKLQSEFKKKKKYGKEELAKSDSIAKTRQSSPSIRKGKLKSNVMNDKGTPDEVKLNAVRHKSKKSPGLFLNSHVESVEGKLNELLDTEGGISKRKDASRGYLKLLFLTAAFGTNGHGEAIQSNRDLSMILDALLKTKSRTVLVDIINKNGLQMLHNIIKRYRKEFNKTPILRKLLKVLEYLAMREILTLEHITGGPPRPGVESFKDSILTLTEHADKQVHQIARNFRDKWIPRSHRKNCFIEMGDGKKEFHQHSIDGKLSVSSGDHWSDRGGKHTDSVECRDKQPTAVSSIETSTVDHSSAPGCSNRTNGTRTRKRKSRWDIPVEECMHPSIRTSFSGDEKQNVDNDIPPGFSSPCKDPAAPPAASSNALNRQRKSRWDIPKEECMHSSIRTSSSGDGKQSVDDNIPPGFSSRCNDPMMSAAACSHPLSHSERETYPSNLSLADRQDRFIAHIPISYGIPSTLVKQFGVLEAEAAEVWAVAPGLPFHPFPPLPPCSSNKGEQSTSVAKCVGKPLEKAVQVDDARHVQYCSGKKRTATCSLDLPELNTPMVNVHPDFQQGGENINLGRKNIKKQKLDDGLVPPLLRVRDG